MELIKPLNKKVNMFATNDELYDQLTNKEIMTIKLAKLEEFADDLYRSTTSEGSFAKLFPPETSWFNIRKLLRELNELND